MPLIHGKSDRAFSQNVRTEMEAGKPQKQSLAIAYRLKRKAEHQKMAEGGPVEGGVHADVSSKEWGGGARRGTSLAGEHVRGATMAKEKGWDKAAASRTESAKNIHRENLNELRSAKKPNLYADGGIVDRIMSKRYSEGGMIANDDEPIADTEPNDFDVLPQEDELEEHYTGANSGDEDGGLADDDMIDRIMLKRKKDRMPRPA